MAIEVVSMPIAGSMTPNERAFNDVDGYKKRLDTLFADEEEKLKKLDELISNNYQIVDVQRFEADYRIWLRYTLHKPAGGEGDAVHSSVSGTAG